MTIAHKTGLIALAIALMAAALLLPPTAASANEDVVGDAAFALVGTAHLSDGIDSNNDEDGCLGGVAVGGGTTDDFLSDPGAVIAAGSPAGAQFEYNNDLTGGDANGDLWIEGLELPSGDTVAGKVGFDWVRVGLTAVVTLHGNENGVAVAALLPVDSPVFDCTGEKKNKDDIVHGAWPNEEHAQVVGVGVILEACDGGGPGCP